MIPYSWNSQTTLNDGTNFAAWFVGTELGLPAVDLGMVSRHRAHPYIGGVRRQGLEVMMEVEVLAGSADTLRAWFDYEDETPKLLIVTDDDGSSNQRYWWALCSGFTPTISPTIWLVTLRVHGDVRLRSVSPTTVVWNVTTADATQAVTNGTAGVNDYAYPIVTITPRAAISGGYIDYRRFVTVKWRAAAAATQYPVDITNSGLDTRIASTNFYSATGEDIQVVVDGAAVDYWTDGINTATTSIWLNLDWQAAATATLSGALDTSAISTLTMSSSISGFPSSGILEIGSELFTYTSKSDSTKTFSGVERAAKGTTAASHSNGDTATWVQHDIWIEYGGASVIAPTTDDDYKPIFNLATSTNTSWVYEDFFEEGATRSGAWSYQLIAHPLGYKYGGNRGAAATVYAEIGSIFPYYNPYTKYGEASWTIYNPCGISAANFTNGEMFVSYTATHWTSKLRISSDGSTWTTAYSVPGPMTNQAWYSWSQNLTGLAAGTRYVQMFHDDGSDPSRQSLMECADVTVTLNSSYTPTVVIVAETGGSRLSATLTNNTTAEAIEIDFGTEVDEALEIDTDTDEVTRLSDGASMYQVVSVVGGSRERLLRLAPGSNTLRFELVATGTIDIDIDVVFEKRWRV